jgi:hypothetical protein
MSESTAASSTNVDGARFDREEYSLRISSVLSPPRYVGRFWPTHDDPLPPCRDDYDYGRRIRVLREEVPRCCRSTAIHFVLTFPFFFQHCDV